MLCICKLFSEFLVWLIFTLISVVIIMRIKYLYPSIKMYIDKKIRDIKLRNARSK